MKAWRTRRSSSRLIVKVERVFATRGSSRLRSRSSSSRWAGVLWGFGRELLHSVEHTPLSLASVWYATFALPLVQFLTLRWLWRWLLWTYMLVRLSRLPLATSHCTRISSAGLSRSACPPRRSRSLSRVSRASPLRPGRRASSPSGVSPETFLTTLGAFVVLSVIIAIGPLLLFSGQIVRARTRDLASHHALAGEFVRDFWTSGSTSVAGIRVPIRTRPRRSCSRRRISRRSTTSAAVT